MAEHIDQSMAPLDEKLRRFLLALAKPDAVHFYDDGFPKPTIASEAYAFLADILAGRLIVTTNGVSGDQPQQFARGSWQHAVDDALVGYMKTSHDFATPHDAVAWLLQITADAAVANAGVTPCQTEQECEAPDLCKVTNGCERMEPPTSGVAEVPRG